MIKTKHLLPLVMMIVFSGCTRLPAYDDTYVIIAPTVSETMTETDSTETPSTEAVPVSTPVSLLTKPEDIAFSDTDGNGHNYIFFYDGEEYQAIYTPDHWKIIDSYKIHCTEDMIIICEALKSEHPIHSADYESYRTAEDMAYEWIQHNLAYELLSDDSEWKAHAKDVDINPEDQGKSVYDFYRERTQ